MINALSIIIVQYYIGIDFARTDGQNYFKFTNSVIPLR